MAKSIGIELANTVFIPCVGVTNCVNICSILKGWGCKYLAIFDYDKEGVESGGNKLAQSSIGELNREFIYLKDVSNEDLESKTYIKEKYMIEDVVTENELKRFKEINGLTGVGKTLTAKLFADAIDNGTYVYGNECKSNFSHLFRRIEMIIKDGKTNSMN